MLAGALVHNLEVGMSFGTAQSQTATQVAARHGPVSAGRRCCLWAAGTWHFWLGEGNVSFGLGARQHFWCVLFGGVGEAVWEEA